MRKFWLIPVGTALVLLGCSLAPTSTAQDDARTLFRVLRENEQVYQQALAAEQETVTRAKQQLQWKASEFESVTSRFEQLYTKLDSLDVNRAVRQDVLAPILRQLQYEQSQLREINELLERSELDALRARLETHQHPTNLFTPAMRKIRENYGVPRQRLWRGHPLTT